MTAPSNDAEHRPGAESSRRALGAAGGRPSVLVVHPGAELYGADRVLLESVAVLATCFEVTVALPDAGPLVGELESLGVRVERCVMPVLRKSALRPRGAWRLVSDAVRGVRPALRLLRSHGTHGVYVNTLTLPSWPLLARLAGRRSLCHVHEAEQSAPRLLRRGMALCPVLSDRVVANSRFTLDVLAEVVPGVRERAAVVRNAVRGPDRATPARSRLDGPVQLLYVGRLSPRKGPQVALAALEELTARGVDARLTLVGEVFGDNEDFQRRLHEQVASAGLDELVHFAGFRSDVWPYLRAADVVLVPSVGDESFGNTAVEAVLAARPVVVSSTSGLLEATDGYASALAAAPGRPAEWADAVQRVAADWDRYRQTAVDDARAARARHGSARFGEQLLAQVAALPRVPASPVRVPGPATAPATGGAG